MAGRQLAKTLKNVFSETEKPRTGIYLGDNRIQIGTQNYIFRNESGISVTVGESLAVKNVGRKAAAEYAPASGAGVFSSASSGGSASTTTLDHAHGIAYGDGGVLDHGGLSGLTDDDHTGYLLATGTRTGATSQAQDFGATYGIKTDKLAESTGAAGVTVVGNLILAGAPTSALHATTKAYVDALHETIMPYIVCDETSVIVNNGEVVWSI